MPSLHSALKPRIYGAACLLPLLSLAPGYTLAQSTDAPASSTSENLSKPRATKAAPAPTRAPTLTQQVQLLQSRLEAQAQEIQALRERLDTQVSQHDELQRQMQAQQGGATAVAEGGYRSPSAANAVPAATAAVGMAPPDPGAAPCGWALRHRSRKRRCRWPRSSSSPAS
jgi:TolA-binding protein